MSDLIPMFAPWGGRVLAGVLAVLGLLLAGYALFRDPARRRPRCPKCWYDATGLTGDVCPECGHRVRSLKDRHRRRRRWKLAFVGLLLMGAVPTWAVTRRVRTYGWRYYTYAGPIRWWSTGHLVPSYRVGDFRVGVWMDRIPWASEPETLCVGGPGGPDVKIEGYRWDVRGGRDGAELFDFNANGVPEVWAEEWSGGAHCCLTACVVELDPKLGPRVIETLDAGAADTVELRDVDGDGRPEVITYSGRFAYWKTSYAGSPAPEEVLAWRDGGFRLAPDLMVKPLPPAEELATEAARVRALLAAAPGEGAEDQPYLWWPMVDLIWTGHPAAARPFLDAAWPPGRAGKEEFWTKFTKQAGASYLNPQTWEAE